MKESRRGFLKIAGLSALGCGPVAAAVARASVGGGSGRQEASVRWAMAIDRRKCAKLKGCTRCIDACNTEHNVPAIEEERHQVQWIWKERYGDVFPELMTRYTDPAVASEPTLVLCNHCDNPPCVRICPTQATWRRDDGVVMMDMHRCIGCRYCIIGCPYAARSFNWVEPRKHLDPARIRPEFPTRTKGVVEKCNFCAERLAQGRGPACVEACPERALTFGNAAEPDSEIAQLLRTHNLQRRRPDLGTMPHVFYIG